MPEEISKGRGLSKLFYFFFFSSRTTWRSSVDRKREESEVDSASSCSPKHMHRPCCERNFTGYIDKRAGSQVGLEVGRKRRGTRKNERWAGSYSGFSSYILFYLKLTKRNEISKRILTLLPGCARVIFRSSANIRLFCPSSSFPSPSRSRNH